MMLVHGNALLALLAALLWGGGDFSGGMGVKRAGGSMGAAVRVVLLSHVMSLCVLLAVARWRGDSFPHGAALGWGLVAGGTAGIALSCFYIALSRGAMGASAALSGLLAAAIPAVVSGMVEGSPGLLRMVGFGVAGLAIWMIAAGPAEEAGAADSAGTMGLALVGGVGFGFYFVGLKMAGSAGVIWPLATARMGSVTVAALLLAGLTWRESGGSGGESRVRLTRSAVIWVAATALLDTSGNLLFLAATRAGRLDVAAVLASLYPASTILMAAWVLRERPTLRQGLGMAAAAVAVVMITL